MEASLDTSLDFFERLATLAGEQFSRSAKFGRDILDASLVEIHVLHHGRLRRIGASGRATARGGSAEGLLCELRGARDALIRPLDPPGRKVRLPKTAAYMPIRVGGAFAGCYTVVYPSRRGALGPVECRTVREMTKLLAGCIEIAQRAAPVRTGLAGIAEAAPDAILATDSNGVIVAWNAAAERLFGHSAAEAIGQSSEIVVPPARREAYRAGLKRFVATGPAPLVRRSLDFRALRKDGGEVPIELSLSKWTESGTLRIGAIMRDVSERRDLEKRLRNAATIDHLTGLANRAGLDRRLHRLLAANRRLTLLLVDLDGFKDVNDTRGHQAGDTVLAEVARRLRLRAGAAHFVARMGGDEFVVLVEDSANPLEGSWLGETLIDAIEEAIPVEDELVSISASVGVAWSSDQSTVETILGDADLALYKAKHEGRGRTRLFTPDLRVRLLEKGLARSELAAAWSGNQFELYYQPQVSLRDGRLCGAEALIRWVHPRRGVLPPGVFLPMIETDALALPVGDWIIDVACRQAAEWRASAFPGFRVAVNLFSVQFKSGDIAGEVARALQRNGLPPEALELEITENTILRSDERILTQLKRLRELGVGLAFDDFGTGYASLSMLRQYPVTKIKIDRSFVSGADVCGKDRAITQALVHMADGLGIEVIAEGIETLEHHALMQAQGCGFGQGYLYSRPVSARTFRALSCHGNHERRAAG